MMAIYPSMSNISLKAKMITVGIEAIKWDEKISDDKRKKKIERLSRMREGLYRRAVLMAVKKAPELRRITTRAGNRMK